MKENGRALRLIYINEFLNSLRSNNYSEKTIISYRRDLSAFENFLQLENISFNNINKLVIDRFKGQLRSLEHHKLFGISPIKSKNPESGSNSISLSKRKLTFSNSKEILSSRTINRMLTSLRRYLKYLLVN